MSAVQLDQAESQMLAALDTAVDALFANGGEFPPATQIMPPLSGYAQSANINKQDFRPTIRKTMEIVLVALMTTPPAWQAPVLLNSWTNQGGLVTTAGYYKNILGRVQLRGIVVGTAGTVVFQLPVGCRPPATVTAMGMTSAGVTEIDIDSSGNVTVVGSTPLTFCSLDLISFDTQ